MRANVSDIFFTQLFVNLDGLNFIIWRSNFYSIERGFNWTWRYSVFIAKYN